MAKVEQSYYHSNKFRIRTAGGSSTWYQGIIIRQTIRVTAGGVVSEQNPFAQHDLAFFFVHRQARGVKAHRLSVRPSRLLPLKGISTCTLCALSKHSNNVSLSSSGALCAPRNGTPAALQCFASLECNIKFKWQGACLHITRVVLEVRNNASLHKF